MTYNDVRPEERLLLRCAQVFLVSIVAMGIGAPLEASGVLVICKRKNSVRLRHASCTGKEQPVAPGSTASLEIGFSKPRGAEDQPSCLRRLLDQIPKQSRAYAEKSVPVILEAAERAGMDDPRHVAYVLATAEAEAGFGKSLVELPPARLLDDPHATERYFNTKYGGHTKRGNRPGTNDGSTYRGRGYVHLTFRNNYTRWSELLGTDLVAHPQKAEIPENAARILVEGMHKGIITGVALSKYINDTHEDWFNARRVVNGIEKGDLQQHNRIETLVSGAKRYWGVLSTCTRGAMGFMQARSTASSGREERRTRVTPSSYIVEWGATHDCEGTGHCYLGSAAAERIAGAGRLLIADGTCRAEPAYWPSRVGDILCPKAFRDVGKDGSAYHSASDPGPWQRDQPGPNEDGAESREQLERASDVAMEARRQPKGTYRQIPR